jgi:CrcB protein
MAINIAGSLAMGIFIEVLARRFGGASNELRLFVATGILGGFTTFSAFSLDVAVLWERGAALYALGYVLVSVVGAILALFLGLWLVRSLG